MEDPLTYRLLADVLLLLHFAIVLFIIGGLVLVVAGNLRHWQRVNSLWFRLAHLAAIGIVAAQAWLGKVCPLTTLESWLREQAGETAYNASFIEHWVQRVLYYTAPPWVFTLAYTVFGLLVVAAWWYFPPQRNKHHDDAIGNESGQATGHQLSPTGQSLENAAGPVSAKPDRL
jgi:hypothetical protein